ncbi:hypothetical protein N7492_001549 [Penicillium capsulatum]|uniref:DUF7053 domain-containing protein n=1 Tax=Penicillium capsulatum TaxID=69766 RepID=A0A9W9ITG2_9EURO|nr:hypothetical protein N7492_001549 [Penicillium capsulatum]KAJ6129398.1 hypothetical protein N7512_002178 [Penicillium capsulatum]
MPHSVFSSRTPLPRSPVIVQSLHDHAAMITQNPLVVQYAPCQPPPFAPPDELDAIWYELTDRIAFLPYGLLSRHVRYHACFHDTPQGLQTHVYAPMGVDIRNDWRVSDWEDSQGGTGMFLQEQVDLRCPFGLTTFVQRTLQRAHAELVDRLATAVSQSLSGPDA